MLISRRSFLFCRVRSVFICRVSIQDFSHVLLAARVMFIRGPVCVKFVSNFAIFLLLVSLLHKGVLEEFGPRESLAWLLVQQALQEGLKVVTHVVGELDWIFDDQVDQRVDTVRVKWWRTHKQLVDNDSQGPQVDSVIVGELLHKFGSHIQRRTLD